MEKKEKLIIIGIIILQTIIYIICGINKSYIHMDEAYSLGLASYDKVEIQDNVDFYNTWHSSTYYEDYLSVQEDEIGKYSQVYENQKNDVHPPLYYLILRFAMGFTKGHYSKWSGIAVNIVIFAFITIFAYLILQELLKDEKNVKQKSLLLAFISSITMASLTNVLYIRMYALAQLNILITTFLHIKLLKCGKLDTKLLIAIGLSALMGSLTHYYYLFYLAPLYVIFAIMYVKQKEWKKLGLYTSAMLVAAVISLLIFPYSIQHMFFGYRGQGAMSKLSNISQFISSISQYLLKINYFGFNNILFVILIAIAILLICCKGKHNKSKVALIIAIPTIIYFILVAISSPWIELRYIMPICSIIFILIMFKLYSLLKISFKEKTANTIIIVTLGVMMIAPAIFKIEPEVMFSDKKEIVSKLSNELNVPTIYMFNSQNNRFLDDILLFAKLDQSYIAKDIECTTENIKNIIQGKDISNGVVVFVNEGQENDELLNTIKDATGLKSAKYLKRLNACDVYFVQ